MRQRIKRTALAGAALVALGLGTQAVALTVTKALPETWIPNGTFGTGATLNVYDLPGGGRQFFFAYFANDDTGSDSWIVLNATTETGKNSYTGLDMVQNTGSTFDPSSSVGGGSAGSADFTVLSCDQIVVDYTLSDGATGSIDFSPLIPSKSCVWDQPFGVADCPSFSAGPDADIPGACVLNAEYTQDITLTNDLHWVIPAASGTQFGADLGAGEPGAKGVVGSTLTIEPGTVIMGESLASTQGVGAFLAIRRGNQIISEGTAEAPVVWTSKAHILDPAENLGSGQWGGLQIVGRATTNDCDVTTACVDELGLNNYGGFDDSDNSGRLRYNRFEYAGTTVSATSELNGVSLYTVGDSTVMEYVHVHRNGDDGFEWFGGTVNGRYLLTTALDDDGYDWTNGARFNVQYAINVMTEDSVKDARGVEGDNDGSNPTLAPVSDPNFANLTIYYEAGFDGPQAGMRIRRGTQGNFSHVLVTGPGASDPLASSACIRISESETEAGIGSGDLTFTNSVLDTSCGPTLLRVESANPADIAATFPGIVTGSVDFFRQIGGADFPDSPSVAFTGNPLLVPAAGSIADGLPALSRETHGNFFDVTDYAGAIKPGSATDYTVGEWTNVEPDNLR